MDAGAVITLLGVRGTAPVDGPEVSRYGGGTSGVLVRMGGETIVLDAGTGILRLGHYLRADERLLHLLLSHPHFDHLVGLPSCSVLYDPARLVRIFAAPRQGLSPREQVERLMSPPLWPVGPEAFRAAVSFHALNGPFALGAVSVEMLEGKHPGGSTVFRLSHGGKSLVYATDYELDEESFPKLCTFAQNCSLLLCDGQYSDEELSRHRGFGHSSWQMAAKLGRKSGAGRLLVIHHAPWRGDRELDDAQPQLKRIFPNGAFARGGEEIIL